MDEKLPKSVTTTVDEATARGLMLVEKTLEIKPAAVARRGLKKILPELIRQAKAASK